MPSQYLLALSCRYHLGGHMHLPPTDSIDRLDYRFEGDLVVVSATFRNVVNLSLGVDTHLDPQVGVIVHEIVAAGGKSWRASMQEFRHAPTHDATLVLDTTQGWGPHGLAAENPGRPPEPGRHGLVQIAPGETLRLESGSLTGNCFDGDEGFYDSPVDVPSFHPLRLRFGRLAEDAEDLPGCFNHDVPEFYGVWEGRSCRHWDCTGASTDDEHVLHKRNGTPKPDDIPACDLTGARGACAE